MKKIIIASALVFSSSIANAADLVVYSAPVAVEPLPVNPPHSPPSWEGGYVGVNAGWVRGNFKHPLYQYLDFKDTHYAEADESLDAKSNSFIGGVQIGYNWNLGNNLVIGLEADFQKTNLKGDFKYFNPERPNWLRVDGTTKVEWFGTARARLGYTPTERMLVYATGGFAYGKVITDVDMIVAADPVSVSHDDIRPGYALGGGIEYAINNNWTIKTEYLYIDLGKKDLYYSDSGSVYTTLKREVSLQTVRVGVNYKF